MVAALFSWPSFFFSPWQYCAITNNCMSRQNHVEGLVWVFFAQDYRAASQQGFFRLFSPHSPLPPSPPLPWKEFQAGLPSFVTEPKGVLIVTPYPLLSNMEEGGGWLLWRHSV